MLRISCFLPRASLLAATTLLLVAGCATGPGRLPVCPGKATVEEALGALAKNAATAVPLWARGEAFLTYHVPDKKVPQRQNLLLHVRFSPPTDIYVQGDVSVRTKIVVMGANRQQFWLALSFEELSSYYSGRWDEARDFDGQMMSMSPQIVLEAFGIIADPNAERAAGSWALANKGPYDILTRWDEASRVVKRMYIYACDYRVYKIEYFDGSGKVAAVAQLGAYEAVEGFWAPTKINVVSTAPDGRKDSMDISLSGLRTTTFSDRQREAFFVPPDPNAFRDVYRYEGGRWMPE